MSDDDLDPSELLNRRIAAVLGDSDSDDAYVAPVEDDVDPELKKQRQIDKMLAEGWVLPEESNKFAPPARAPPLPPRKTTAPAGVFQTKIDYDASHMWRDSLPDQADEAEEEGVKIDFEGTAVAIRYDVKEELGSGITSIVFRAVEKETEKEVVVKVLSAATSEIISRAVWGETHKQLEAVQGDGVVKLLEAFEENEHIFLVEQKYDGLFVKQLWESEVEWTERKAAVVITTLLGAVKRIHDAGFAHNDVSPGNLLSAKDLSGVVLAGFGKCTPLDSKSDVHCTAHLKAPELVAKAEHGTPVDVWAIGCLTYLLLSGKWPFHDPNRLKLNLVIQEAKFDFPEEQWANISEQAKAFIKHCLALKPEERITTDVALNHDWITNSEADAAIADFRKNLGATMSYVKGESK